MRISIVVIALFISLFIFAVANSYFPGGYHGSETFAIITKDGTGVPIRCVRYTSSEMKSVTSYNGGTVEIRLEDGGHIITTEPTTVIKMPSGDAVTVARYLGYAGLTVDTCKSVEERSFDLESDTYMSPAEKTEAEDNGFRTKSAPASPSAHTQPDGAPAPGTGANGNHRDPLVDQPADADGL